MSNEMLAALAEIGVFRSLHPQDRQIIASLLRPKSFSANEIIFMEGDEGRGMYLIRSGRIKICVNDQQGNELIFTFLSAGDMLGEIAILDGGPRSASAIEVKHKFIHSSFSRGVHDCQRMPIGVWLPMKRLHVVGGFEGNRLEFGAHKEVQPSKRWRPSIRSIRQDHGFSQTS